MQEIHQKMKSFANAFEITKMIRCQNRICLRQMNQNTIEQLYFEAKISTKMTYTSIRLALALSLLAKYLDK